MKKSLVEKMSLQELKEFVREINRIASIYSEDYCCEYGHFGCSTYDDGPCSDEAFGHFDNDPSHDLDSNFRS